MLLLIACSSPSPSTITPAISSAGQVNIEIDYGSEKKAWMEAMVKQGVKVGSFRELEVDLEDIFMNVTKGGVQ
mgnify:CR=1 FL=1